MNVVERVRIHGLKRIRGTTADALARLGPCREAAGDGDPVVPSLSEAAVLSTAHHDDLQILAASYSFKLGILIGQSMPSIMCVSW